MSRFVLLAACSVLVCGCATHSYCLGDQPYSRAPSIAPLQPVEGLKVPESSAALKIPPPPANPVPFGRKVKDDKGEDTVQCLDRPPPMPKQAEDKPAEPKAEEKKSSS